MARPRCPRHPDWKVWRDGTYGKPGQKRQRYKCVSPDGAVHVFTEWLPGQGPKASGRPAETTARNYSFTTREIGAALVRVGRGESYRAVAAFVRERAGRAGKGGSAAHPQLIEDWVEAFAPIVFAHHAPERWPAMVQLVELPTGAGGQSTFRVLGAVGQHRQQPYLFAVRAYPAVTEAARQDLLGALPGAPRLVAADGWEPARAVERRMRRVGASLGKRGRQLRNRERTNRLLMLVQLQVNGHAREAGYAGVIEEWLASRGGYAPKRRRISDPRGRPSLG